jgi:hypothetical protein
MATTASTAAHMASVTSGPGVARSKDGILSNWRRARSGQSGPYPGRGKGRAVVLACRHANGCLRRRRIDLIPAMSGWSGAPRPTAAVPAQRGGAPLDLREDAGKG